MVRPKANFRTSVIKAGYSLRGLSLKIGASPTTLQQACKHSTLYPSTAKKICEALGKEFDELFEIADSKKEV